MQVLTFFVYLVFLVVFSVDSTLAFLKKVVAARVPVTLVNFYENSTLLKHNHIQSNSGDGHLVEFFQWSQH